MTDTTTTQTIPRYDIHGVVQGDLGPTVITLTDHQRALVTKVADHLAEAHDREVNMGDWVAGKHWHHHEAGQDEDFCGYAACFAGHLALIGNDWKVVAEPGFGYATADITIYSADEEYVEHISSWQQAAADALQIEHIESHPIWLMFFTTSWPDWYSVEPEVRDTLITTGHGPLFADGSSDRARLIVLLDLLLEGRLAYRWDEDANGARLTIL